MNVSAIYDKLLSIIFVVRATHLIYFRKPLRNRQTRRQRNHIYAWRTRTSSNNWWNEMLCWRCITVDMVTPTRPKLLLKRYPFFVVGPLRGH